MTTYHAIATPTLKPTLRSARDVCGRGNRAQIVASGTAEECYEFLRSRNMLAIAVAIDDADEVGGKISLKRMLEGELSVTADWTYRIAGDLTTEEPRSNVRARREETEMARKFQLDSVRRNVAEWFDVAARHYERAAEEMRRNAVQFSETLDKELAGEKQWYGSLDHLSSALNHVSNARQNLREDMLLKYAAELAAATKKGV